MSYAEVQRMVDDTVPVGDRYYWKSNFLADLKPELANVLENAQMRCRLHSR